MGQVAVVIGKNPLDDIPFVLPHHGFQVAVEVHGGEGGIGPALIRRMRKDLVGIGHFGNAILKVVFQVGREVLHIEESFFLSLIHI